MTDQGRARDRAERTKLLTAYMLNLPLPEAWRTQVDYWNERKRSRRVHVVALVSVIVSSLCAVGASLGAMAVMSGQAPVLSDVVRVECVAPATPPAK